MEEERKRACDRRKKGFPGELIGKGDPDYPLSARFQTVSRLSAPVGVGTEPRMRAVGMVLKKNRP